MRSASHRGTRPPCNGKSANPERFIYAIMCSMAAAASRNESSKTLLLIGLFKLLKGIALLAIGVGALKLLHRDIAQVVEHWVKILRLDPENRHLQALLARALRINPHKLKELSAGTFIYAALFLTEGTGLLLRRRWAEYFTIVTTGAFIPLEVYELAKHITWIKIALLVLNIAIVVYLVVRVRRSA
jgi:uncharacterized membrane protein (DUF2068 family)